MCKPALIGLAVLLTASFALPLAAVGTGKGPPLKVCLLKNNMPYSEFASKSGFDHDVADVVARAGGRQLKPIWIDNDAEISEIDASDYPFARLARFECDAIFSTAGPASDSLAGNEKLTLGQAYYGAAFELLACKADVQPRFRALRGLKVAIQSQTVAHFALVMVKAEPVNYFSLAAAFNGLIESEADAALLWGPAIGSRLRYAIQSGEVLRDPELARCKFVDAYAPPAAVRWNLHVATRKASPRLRSDIDKALVEMMADGRLNKIMRGYGIPRHLPFATTYSLGAVNDLQSAH